MSYKTIVVHLGTDTRADARLGLACRLAAESDAHLVGLFALAALPVPFTLTGNAGSVLESEMRWRQEVAAERRAQFTRASAEAGIALAEWRQPQDEALRALRVSARYADLIVMGQRDAAAADARVPAGLIEDVVLSGGRPVLIVPYAGRFASVGARVLVAWNASREAARAITDALPILARARHVEVVVFDGGGDHGEQPGADLALWLARHGVKATAAQQHAGFDVGEQILSRAADTDADLIVMGAYGHSRTRELVLGGATRTLLGAMTVPVLMSH